MPVYSDTIWLYFSQIHCKSLDNPWRCSLQQKRNHVSREDVEGEVFFLWLFPKFYWNIISIRHYKFKVYCIMVWIIYIVKSLPMIKLVNTSTTSHGHSFLSFFFFFLCVWWEYLRFNVATFQRRQWHPIPVLLHGKLHGQRRLVGCSPWGC